jgi:cell division protein FtsI (penicillin-binding protein 3)
MRHGELVRVRFAFGLLGAVPVFLAGWLGWLQVAQAGQLSREGRTPLRLVPETADGQARHQEHVPAPRGTILDRNGNVLALDCETYEVRADVRVPAALRKDAGRFRAWLADLVDAVSLALADNPELADRADARARHLERLAKLFGREFKTVELPANGPVAEDHPMRADVLVASDVDSLSVIEALRRVTAEKRFATVTLHFLHTFERDYPERDFTHGVVGHIDSKWVVDRAGRSALHTFGVCGLEALSALEPESSTSRAFLKDGKGLPYFLAPLDGAPTPNVVRSTLDIDLQRIAIRELAAQAEAGAKEGKVTIPKWGALVLVEMATGDVLAAASWHRDAKYPQAASFTPYQSLFEPGSIVKPLVIAYAYEAGVLDWNHVYDCAPGSADYRQRIAALGRAKPVRDDHDCHDLTAHGIIVNSSNIGASYIGLQLDRAQWQDYMRFYGVGASLGLGVPNTSTGGTNRLSFSPQTPLRSFRANSAISFSFGYELQVTTMHIARAYLRLFRGARAELRLCRGAEIDGVWHDSPLVKDAGPHFRADVLDAVREAMVDVVSNDPHATGSHVHAQVLKELGIDLHGVVGGKTGTAASNVPVDGRTMSVRNASFVGFLPVESPRYLAVCVLQKDDSAKFYGGSYAAPPVVRLLLQCQQLEQQRLLRQESHDGPSGQARAVSASPGDSGWGRGAPETTSVGR